ncbi:TPA: hypothetical protein ACH3X1_001655 [Trebouxia sp. C0004]
MLTQMQTNLMCQKTDNSFLDCLVINTYCLDMLGLANSHDTAKKIAEAVLEENQEALQKCLKALAELGYAKTANRERADRPSAKKHHKVSVKLASQIDMVF